MQAAGLDQWRSQGAGGTMQGSTVPDSVQLPLKDYASVQRLKQRLESEELHNQLVKSMQMRCQSF
jgi:hypothetical protein